MRLAEVTRRLSEASTDTRQRIKNELIANMQEELGQAQAERILEFKPNFHGITFDGDALWHRLHRRWKACSSSRKALCIVFVGVNNIGQFSYRMVKPVTLPTAENCWI